MAPQRRRLGLALLINHAPLQHHRRPDRHGIRRCARHCPGCGPHHTAVDATSAATDQGGNLATVLPVGSIEAPTQPQGVSSANYSRTARVRPVSRTGGNYEAKISSPLSSLFRVRGVQENEVNGIGIVMGLDATGDSGLLAPQLLANSLLASNINIDPKLLATSSIATVHVKGVIPHGAKPGTRMDVIVSTLGDAESLFGGNLLITELMDIEGNNVYATASGSLTVGGFFAAGDAASTTKNHVTVGTLANAGRVQMGVDASVRQRARLHLPGRQERTGLLREHRASQRRDQPPLSGHGSGHAGRQVRPLQGHGRGPRGERGRLPRQRHAARGGDGQPGARRDQRAHRSHRDGRQRPPPAWCDPARLNRRDHRRDPRGQPAGRLLERRDHRGPPGRTSTSSRGTRPSC